MAHQAADERASANGVTGEDSATSLSGLRVADDELPDVNESLPLHKAAFFGNLEAIKDGTVDCSDVDGRDRWGLTALHWAVIGEKALPVVARQHFYSIEKPLFCN
jgi:ankyrin repeat protein